MNAWRSLLVVSILLVLAAESFLIWEKRAYRTSPAAGAAQTDLVAVPDFHAGGEPAVMTRAGEEPRTHEDDSGYDVGEGKRLYSWFHCIACHANGGGGIGPALMDDQWIYGAEPRQIYASIVEGRPNGMPSFRGKIPEEQVWQIVAYVRSMSGHVAKHALPGRNDDISAKSPESLATPEPVHRTKGQ